MVVINLIIIVAITNEPEAIKNQLAQVGFFWAKMRWRGWPISSDRAFKKALKVGKSGWSSPKTPKKRFYRSSENG